MQYCLYQNREDTVKYPYLLDIQSNIIDILNTRLVIPLFDSRLVKKPLPVRLNPQLSINGQVFILIDSPNGLRPSFIIRERNR
ncbi:MULTISPECIES: CcdB family protein [unclassified Providencia]|uniref:CcdB family protein n=1 Tax=unclassified Providencia TaxID=2633465 RepID=UPI00234AD6C1|nr:MULTISPECIES: CcdB family protein [unclassified Providencia]